MSLPIDIYESWCVEADLRLQNFLGPSDWVVELGIHYDHVCWLLKSALSVRSDSPGRTKVQRRQRQGSSSLLLYVSLSPPAPLEPHQRPDNPWCVKRKHTWWFSFLKTFKCLFCASFDPIETEASHLCMFPLHPERMDFVSRFMCLEKQRKSPCLLCNCWKFKFTSSWSYCLKYQKRFSSITGLALR